MAFRLSKLLFLALLLALSGTLAAQTNGNVEVTIIKNDSLTAEFVSQFAPSIGTQPQNGTVTMVQDPIYNYTLTYRPDADFTGSDNFLIVSFPFGFNVRFTRYTISVEEAQIRAHRDVSYTAAGQPVTIDVAANDYINVGNINLLSAPVANGGSVAVADGGITFTPSPGFSGLADFNYVVCTDDGTTCDLGTATVIVEDASVSADTIRVFTKRNDPQFILTSPGAQQLEAPDFGQVIAEGDVMSYLPQPDFVGDDYVTYSNGTRTDVFHITVLNLDSPEFTTEDRSQTVPNEPIAINVLSNDLYGTFADCVEFFPPRFGTVAPGARNGEVIYTPPSGWTGVDFFQYSSRPPGCNGAAETQLVYVNVTDFAPEQPSANLTLPAATTTQLTYDVPGQSTRWTVVDGPTLGTVVTDPLTGHLNYLAAAPGSDRLTISYCLSPDGNGNCAASREVDVRITVTAPTAGGCTTGDGCVWPGDTNADGVVDVNDLHAIGLAMGEFGTPRLETGATDWGGQFSESWGRDLNGVDLSHVDANGDQVISHLDTLVVRQHLNLAHRLRPAVSNFVNFEVSLLGDFDVEPGDLVQLDIVAGSNLVIVEDLSGFSFPFQYDPTFVDGSSIGIEFNETSWASYDSPILSLSTNDQNGLAQGAFTRTSGEATSGWGIVGSVNLVIVEDLSGFNEQTGETASDNSGIGRDEGEQSTTGGNSTTITLGGGTAQMTTGNGYQDAVRVQPFELTIHQQAPTELQHVDLEAANAFLDDHLLAFPNPTAGRLTVHLNGQQTFSGLQLTDLTGRVVLQENNLDTNHRELDLAPLRSGLYTLTLTTADGVVNRKIRVE